MRVMPVMPVRPRAGTASDIGDAQILLPPFIARDSVIHVRALLVHPMLTGLSRDAQGNPLPAYFVREVTVSYAGEPVARFEWTSGVSRDPYVAFPLRATREGPIEVSWKDNRGAVYHQQTLVRFS
jgi:sulfur-oxidizing protein SoxZ